MFKRWLLGPVQARNIFPLNGTIAGVNSPVFEPKITFVGYDTPSNELATFTWPALSVPLYAMNIWPLNAAAETPSRLRWPSVTSCTDSASSASGATQDASA